MSMERRSETVGRGPNIRPLGALCVWAIALMAGLIVVLTISAIIDWTTLADFEENWDNPTEQRTEWTSNLWISGIALLLRLATGIVVIIWLWNARRNAEMLSATRHRLPIGWVIGGWFCPVVNLWFPYWIMTDVVRESDQHAPAIAGNSHKRTGDGVVVAWWLALLASWALGFVALILGLPKPRSTTTDRYTVYAVAPLGGFGLIVVELITIAMLTIAAFCLGAIMIRVQRSQEAQAAHPIAAPRPMQFAVGNAVASPAIQVSPNPGPPVLGEPTAPVTGPHTLPMRDEDPSAIGPFTLTGRLGSDSVGDSYLGRAADTGAVVRVLHPYRVNGSCDRAELTRIFNAARTVHSDFTPKVLDADVDAPRPWLATEYIAGRSIRELVAERGGLAPSMVERTAADVAHALSALHDAGLVHGALNSESVIVTESGSRVVNFGIPTAHLEPSVHAAPEHLAGEAGGPASDMFSLGVVLARALTGRAPFGDANPAMLLQRMATQPPDLTGIADSRLRFVIAGCLAREPHARLTAAQVLGYLEPGAPSQRTPWTTSAAAPLPPPAKAAAPPDLIKSDLVFEITAIGAVVLLAVIIVTIAFALS